MKHITIQQQIHKDKIVIIVFEWDKQNKTKILKKTIIIEEGFDIKIHNPKTRGGGETNGKTDK